jgi:membrane protein YdbS with pleckstrin-like domain
MHPLTEPAPDPTSEAIPQGRQAFDPRWIPAERVASRIFVSIFGLVTAVALLVLYFLGIIEWKAWIALCVVWILLVPPMAYFGQRWPTWEYPYCGWRLTDQSLDLWKGLWKRRQVRVPRSRVQYTDVTQGPVQRRFGLGTLQVHVAGTEAATISVPGLPHELALRLRDELLDGGGDDGV